MSKLSKSIKDELIQFCTDMRHEYMFGDELELDMILHGITIKGLLEMTDEELIAECESYGDGELPEKARAELAIEEMLS